MNRGKWFLLLSACLIAFTWLSTEIRTNIGDFFFASEDQDAGFIIGQMQTEEVARRYVVSLNHKGVESDTVFRFLQHWQSTLKNSEEVRRVWSGELSQAELTELLGTYAGHQIHLFSLDPDADIPALFSKTGLQRQSELIRETLLGPDPTLAKKLLASDPMMLTLTWFNKLSRPNSHADAADSYSNFLVETVAPGLEPDAQAAFQDFLERTFGETNADFGNAFSMEYTGIPVFSVKIREQVSADIQRISTLSSVALLLVFLLLFRSLKALLATGIVLLVSISSAVLITCVTFGYIHGLTLALGITLAGICIDYFIHGIVHAVDREGDARRHSLDQIWPSLWLGGITTVIGYAAIGMSGFPGLQQIAVFAATAILTALLITRYILPDLMQLFGFSTIPRLNPRILLQAASQKSVRIGMAVLILVLFAGGLRSLEWSRTLDTLTPEIAQLKEDDARIRSRMADIEPGRLILVTDPLLEKALQTSETLYKRLAALRNTSSLEDFSPVVPWIASRQLQLRNAEAWNRELAKMDQAIWHQALESAGLSSSAFPPLREAQNTPLSIEQLKTTPVWEILARQLVQRAGEFSVVTFLGKHDPRAIQQVLADLPSARYFSQKDSIDQLAIAYREKALKLLGWGLLAILALLFNRYRSIADSLLVLAPSALAVSAVLGIWGLSGTPINILNLIGLLLVAAICVDYGIFFFENRCGDESLTFKAITVSALTSFASFACLGIAENPALSTLAWTVAPGVLVGFILCPVVLQYHWQVSGHQSGNT